jgi:hypothetical protein
MGVPEGADLNTTPLSPPEKHYIKITGTAQLSSDGTLSGEVNLTAEGQSDATVRSLFRTNSKSQWNALLEKEILKISPLAEVISIDLSDPINYKSGPINIKISYRIAQFAMFSEGKAIFTPIIASHIFKIFQPHLSFDTGIRDRKYPFRDRCSRLVELKEEIKLPEGMKPVFIPAARKKDGETCSYDCSYMVSGDKLVLNEKIILGKRIYDSKDWPEFRDAVNAQDYFAENPVIFRGEQ